MATVNFHDWARTGLMVDARADGVRLRAELTLRFRESSPQVDAAPPREMDASAQFQLASFADVVALANNAITRRYPAAGARASEPSRLALVELADPALPWLYSPEFDASGPSRPWLVLVVGSESSESPELELFEALDQPQIQLGAALLAGLPPLSSSALWAHVQSVETATTARLLCPRVLDPNTRYVAALVPAFRVVDGRVQDAWVGAPAEGVRLPVYDAWRFETGDADDFLALALALQSRMAPAHLGRVPLRYARVPLAPRPLAEGALSSPLPIADAVREATLPLDPWPAVAELPAAIAADLSVLRNLADTGDGRDERGRPIITLPSYGQRWTGTSDATGPEWARELNNDPRNRSVCGVGVKVAIEAQTRLVDATIARMGAHQEAAQRINHLALGINAARSLWRRHLPPRVEDKIQLLGPSMGRIVTEHGTLLDVVTNSDRPLAAALFSSAARRVLREGPARSALARAPLRPKSVLRFANRCPVAPANPSGLPTLDTAPFAPRAAFDAEALANRAIAPAGASDGISELLGGLADAVRAATGSASQPAGSVSLPSWRQASPVPTLEISWVDGAVVPRTYGVRLTVELIGETVGASDAIDATVRVLPVPLWLPVAWTLTLQVTGAGSVVMSGSAATTRLALPAGFGERNPIATLTLHAAGRADVADTASVPVRLAPFAGLLTARTVVWHETSVEVDIDAKVTNLSSASASVAASLQTGTATGDVALSIGPTLGPREAVRDQRRLSIATASDAAEIALSLRVAGLGTPVLRLGRPPTQRVTLESAPWIPLYLIATAAAVGEGGEHALGWTDMLRSWTERVVDEGMDAWSDALADTELDGLDADTVLAVADALARVDRPDSPLNPCRPVQLRKLAHVLDRAFDPTSANARAIERVSGTISGRDPDAGTEPLGVCPAVPIPLWELLRDHAKDWLLPGLGTVQQDAVIGLQTNQRFIDAFVVGANEQLMNELAWRGVPILPRCTPLNRFWGRTDPESGELLADIEGIARWGETGLADPSHRVDDAAAALVVLVRSELFTRYPATLVYLLPAGDPERPDFENHEAHQELPRVYPNFQGGMGGDVVFFGFTGVTPSVARGHWVVIEEPDRGFRFWSVKSTSGGEPQTLLADALAAAAGGGELAGQTFADPIRVLIRGDEILPELEA